VIANTTIVLHTGDTATTILAAFGVGLAVLSLGWQAWSFLLAGSRVSVEVGDGLKDGNKVATIARTATPVEIASLEHQGLTERVLSVRVNNAGRGPTSVVAVGIEFQDGGAISDARLNPPLPFRLDGESEQTWYFEASLASEYVKAFRTPGATKPALARGYVRLGGRKSEIKSENQVAVPNVS
jgi:hypothetical protein